MEAARKNFVLVLFFSFLFGTGTWILNSIQARKIRTTEFVNLGADIGWISGLAAFAILGPFITLPVTWLLNKRVTSLAVKVIVFTVLNTVLGLGVFKLLFNDFIAEYQLNWLSACLIFAAAGIGYALFEHKSELWNQRIDRLNGPER